MNTSTVLIVEDNETLLALYHEILKGAGYNVLTAPDAKSAIEYINQSMPDVIVTDLSLPDLNGIEFARHVRRLASGQKVPIILLSGFEGRIEYAKLLHENFNAFLLKPIEPLRLLEEISRFAARNH